MVDVKDFVSAGLYDTPDEVIRDALRSLMQTRPSYRTEIAVSRHRQGGVSVAKAAQLAEVSSVQMAEILDARGVVPEIGPADLDEAREEVETLREYLS